MPNPSSVVSPCDPAESAHLQKQTHAFKVDPSYSVADLGGPMDNIQTVESPETQALGLQCVVQGPYVDWWINFQRDGLPRKLT